MAEPVQVRFTLSLRDQRSMWMQDGCKAYMDSHLDYFQKPSLGGRPNTKPGDYGTPNTHNRWFSLFHHVWGPPWTEIHWNSIWVRAQSHMASQYTWGSVTTLHDFGGVIGQPLDTFFWTLTISWSRLLARVLKISATYYLKIRNTTHVYFISRILPTDVELVVWTL
jgi:hypothetical protein